MNAKLEHIYQLYFATSSDALNMSIKDSKNKV